MTVQELITELQAGIKSGRLLPTTTVKVWGLAIGDAVEAEIEQYDHHFLLISAVVL